MSPQKKYDLDLFRELVKSGHTKKEIMAKMSIKYLVTFNNLKLKLIDADKKYYAVAENKKIAARKPLKVSIGINKTLTLSAKTLEDSGFDAGDAFRVRVLKNKIILSLIEE